jgi:hypothetical protein
MEPGPRKDPNALRRERDNFTLRQLSRTPYAGPVPRFPLPQVRMMVQMTEEGRRWKEFSAPMSDARNKREAELWAWAWTLPQAHVWAEDPWRLMDIAMWVRTQAICEAEDAAAGDRNSLHKFGVKIGMGPDGLKENGWSIARDEVAERRDEVEPVPEGRAASAKARLKAV